MPRPSSRNAAFRALAVRVAEEGGQVEPADGAVLDPIAQLVPQDDLPLEVDQTSCGADPAAHVRDAAAEPALDRPRVDQPPQTGSADHGRERLEIGLARIDAPTGRVKPDLGTATSEHAVEPHVARATGQPAQACGNVVGRDVVERPQPSAGTNPDVTKLAIEPQLPTAAGEFRFGYRAPRMERCVARVVHAQRGDSVHSIGARAAQVDAQISVHAFRPRRTERDEAGVEPPERGLSPVLRRCGPGPAEKSVSYSGAAICQPGVQPYRGPGGPAACVERQCGTALAIECLVQRAQVAKGHGRRGEMDIEQAQVQRLPVPGKGDGAVTLDGGGGGTHGESTDRQLARLERSPSLHRRPAGRLALREEAEIDRGEADTNAGRERDLPPLRFKALDPNCGIRRRDAEADQRRAARDQQSLNLDASAARG